MTMVEKTCCSQQNNFITEDLFYKKGFIIKTMYKQILFSEDIKNAKLAQRVWYG